MHHELSYSRRAARPADVRLPGGQPPAGGATGLADAAAVLEALPRDLVARFEVQGWQLVRTYRARWAGRPRHVRHRRPGPGDAYCRGPRPRGRLVRRPGAAHPAAPPRVVRHPVTGRRCWFNQVAFLSEWTLDPDVRELLVEEYGAEALPLHHRVRRRRSRSGPDVVRVINEAYESLTRREPWQSGDLMLVDNVRTAHSREAYPGPARCWSR